MHWDHKVIIGVNNETNTPDDKYFILKCKNFARALVSSNKHFFRMLLRSIKEFN